GHGGVGGKAEDFNFDGSGAGGISYDSSTNPTDFGSTGSFGQCGSPNYGGGGGLIRLNVSGALTVNGSLSANGGDAGIFTWNGGSGGGTVNIYAGTITGTGSISSNGGAGDNRGGGGGGGLIAITRGGGST